MTKAVQIFAVVVSLIIMAVTFWVNWETKASNKLVEQSTVASNSGDSLTAQAAEEMKKLYTGENLTAFPGNREKLAGTAQATSDFLDKAIEQYKLAAAKLEEAAKNPVDKTVVEYWELKAKAYHKFAESKEVYKRMALLVRDTKIDTAEKLSKEVESLGTTAEDLTKQFQAFSDQADKIKTDHPTKFN